VRDDIERYRRAGVRPFGVNPAAPEAHRAYAGRLGLPFLLLADPALAIAHRYHAVRPGGERVDRTVYLIEQDGTVRCGLRGSPGADQLLEGLEEGNG
jgi:peroxiredoxin